ncbi:MAG TPA: hypothetical protein VFY84_11260, partial [Jiangellales bacterium]|nr:hypothetical protein [Jiangellales bacterium]
MSETVRPTAAQAHANLHAVLHLVAGGRLRCSETTRRPAAATVAAVADVLDGGDFYPGEPIAAFAWPLLLQAGGLAELAGGRLQLTDRGRTALARPVAATIRQLWRSWVTTTVLDEFNRIDQVKGQRAANVLTSVKTRRKAVAIALVGCPRDEWIAIDDLFATMRRKRETSPTVARSERALWKLYLVDPQYGSLGYAGFADWPILEGRYTLAVLFEYAATLGLIDVDYTAPAGARTDYHDNWGADDLDYLSRYDGLSGIRVNPLGACALGLTGDYQPPASTTVPERTLKVLPTLDIVAVGDPTAADRLVLDAHAEHASDRVWTVRAHTRPQSLWRVGRRAGGGAESLVPRGVSGRAHGNPRSASRACAATHDAVSVRLPCTPRNSGPAARCCTGTRRRAAPGPGQSRVPGGLPADRAAGGPPG